MQLVPYKIVNKDGKPYSQVETKDGETTAFSPEEISAIVLTKMKATAEAFLGKIITDACEDLNQRILEYLIKLIKNKYRKDISKDSRALAKLRIEAERVKRAFSSQQQVVVELFDDLSEPLTFEELNDLLTGLVKKAMTTDARLEKHQIDDILLVGESINIPKVQHLRDYFNGKVEPKKSVNLDEAVAIGVAVAGDLLIGAL
ncbi:hypothetical protein E3N88_09834 [Mikania micrantha]|uniref:Uncharacterized protein n=1 Tax=Mikania micrantha TaxID=192012 RepID=A0A5N6PL15_9ASTR|nr:hypothetical protein E3N88_09834 [Mikania micrantha]